MNNMLAFRYLGLRGAAVRRQRNIIPPNLRARITTTPILLSGKEDKLHEDSEARSKEIHDSKEDMLKRVKNGTGHWKEELASSSEAIIKTERGEIEASDETIKKMQEDTKNATTQNKKSS